MDTPLSRIPFLYRLAGLILLAAAIALWDYRKHGPSGTRWREYSFLLAAAMLGGLFGLANDTLTSRLSPEYFIYGKGIVPGPYFHHQVLILGFQAGFGAAFVAAACFLFANNPKPNLPSLPYRKLSVFILQPILAALVLAVILGVTSRWFIRPTFDPRLAQFAGPAAAVWFWRVWCIHLGLYLGLLFGTISAVLTIRRARRRLSINAQ
jgi:hypothetical protein